MPHDFETNLDSRLSVMDDARSPDDIPFLIACIHYWRNRATAAEVGEALTEIAYQEAV